MKLAEETRDKAAVIIGIAIGIFGSTAYQAAENVSKLSILLWAGFIAEYVIFLIVGVWVALKPIKRAYKSQGEMENRIMEQMQKLEKELELAKKEISKLKDDKISNIDT